MVTIRDVAKRAGVGIATVSRFMTDSGPVSEKTATRIGKAIEELHYRPSHLARSLPSGRSQTIGVYMPVIRGTFYASMLNRICMSLRENGLRMMVAIGSEPTKEREEVLQGVQFLAEHGCDGLLIMATALKTSDITELLEARPHLVMLNRMIPCYRARSFAPDHAAAGRLAAATLWDSGHRRFAAIEGNSYSLDNIARMRGFMEELARRDVDFARIPVVCGHFSPEGGRTAAAMLLKRHRGFTALFCASDESASGALSQLHQAGVSVPGDISVLGYDGLELAGYTAPPLTTIRIPWDDICVSAVHSLLNERYGFELPIKRSFAAEVLWRASVKVIGKKPINVPAGGKQ